MFEAFSIFSSDLAGMHIRRESFDVFVRFFDICAKFRAGSKRRIAQPVMANHAFFIGICDCTRF